MLAGTAPAGDREGQRLHRSLLAEGVEIEDLRRGSGPGTQLLRVALELTTRLAGGPVVVGLDHLDGVVARPQQSKADPLGTLRAALQQLPDLQLLLVGRTAGPIEHAIHDRTHPLFQAGQVEVLRRAEPSRFVDDLIIARARTDAPIDVIRTAAELAAGAPAYTWAVVDLAGRASGDNGVERALSAWRELRTLCEMQTARQFDLLRAVHPVAQPVLAATGASKVDLLGHSEGTVMPRYWMNFLGGGAKVHRYVMLTLLWHGTQFYGAAAVQSLGLALSPQATMLLTGTLVGAACGSCSEFLTGSPFLQVLS